MTWGKKGGDKGANRLELVFTDNAKGFQVLDPTVPPLTPTFTNVEL